MYNRSPRFPPVKSSTTKDVGPNTYTTCLSSVHLKTSCAPFLTSSIRIKDIKPKSDVYYDVNVFRHIEGGSSLRNKAERKSIFDRKPEPEVLQPVPEGKEVEKTGEKLYVCHVPYTIGFSAPSIPTKKDQNGYDIDPEGKLIKIAPNTTDQTLGPAFYKKEKVKQFSCGPCKGYEWSRSGTKRSVFKIKDGPGPGNYDLEVPKTPAQLKDEEFRQMARRYSFLPRYSEKVEMDLIRNNFPGPAQYLPLYKNIQVKYSKSIVPLPFLTKKERVTFKIGDGPGPADYDVKLLDTRLMITSAPFGKKSPRFKKKKPLVIPGPGDYSFKSSVDEMLERNKNSLVIPPFNMTSDRGPVTGNKGIESNPSPADYDVRDKGIGSKIEKTKGILSSKVKRFKMQNLDLKLEPAAFNVNEAFHKLHSKREFSKRKVGFSSATDRPQFPPIKTDFIEPTRYDTTYSFVAECKGHRFPVAKPRFERNKNLNPGPGYYCIHPAIEVSIFKAYNTHNLHLKESVLRKRLRFAPRETYDAWLADLKKTKRLKFFYTYNNN